MCAKHLRNVLKRNLNLSRENFNFIGVSPATINMFAVRPLLRNQQQQQQRNIPSNKLHQAIDESFEEYKNLEKERKKVTRSKLGNVLK